MNNQIHVSLLTVCGSYKSPCEQSTRKCMAAFSCLGRMYLRNLVAVPRRDAVIGKRM